MKHPAGAETKVAVPAYASVLAGAGLELAKFIDPTLRLPPQGLVILLWTAVTAALGYYLPHTPRTLPAVQPPATTTGGTT